MDSLSLLSVQLMFDGGDQSHNSLDQDGPVKRIIHSSNFPVFWLVVPYQKEPFFSTTQETSTPPLYSGVDRGEEGSTEAFPAACIK